jgi:hypothetical protein
MQFEVTYDDDRVEEVHVIPSARRAFEAHSGEALPDAMRSGRSDWADFLVWKTLQLRQGETRELEDWLVTVDALKFQIEEVDPTGDEETATPVASSRPQAQRKNSKR